MQTASVRVLAHIVGLADPVLPATIVCVSRLAYRKGIDLLIAAIPLVCAANPKVRFIIGTSCLRLHSRCLTKERRRRRTETNRTRTDARKAPDPPQPSFTLSFRLSRPSHPSRLYPPLPSPGCPRPGPRLPQHLAHRSFLYRDIGGGELRVVRGQYESRRDTGDPAGRFDPVRRAGSQRSAILVGRTDLE